MPRPKRNPSFEKQNVLKKEGKWIKKRSRRPKGLLNEPTAEPTAESTVVATIVNTVATVVNTVEATEVNTVVPYTAPDSSIDTDPSIVSLDPSEMSL